MSRAQYFDVHVLTQDGRPHRYIVKAERSHEAVRRVAELLYLRSQEESNVLLSEIFEVSVKLLQVEFLSS